MVPATLSLICSAAAKAADETQDSAAELAKKMQTDALDELSKCVESQRKETSEKKLKDSAICLVLVHYIQC